MAALVEQISRQGGMTRQEVREQTRPKAPARGKPRAFTFTYKAPTRQFAFSLSFKKSEVEPDEVIETLERILDDLKTQRATDQAAGTATTSDSKDGRPDDRGLFQE